MFVLCSLTVACNQLLERELVPEGGRILYAALETPTGFVRSDRITFQGISTSGDAEAVVQLEIPVQTSLSTVPGVFNPPCPDWTQDGRYVAFNEGRNIIVFDAREEELIEFELEFDFLSMVVWSPDQIRLAFSGNQLVDSTGVSTVWLADLRTMSWQSLVDCRSCTDPAWHPDGSLIAYVNHETDGIEVFDLSAGHVIDTFPIARSAFSTSDLGQGPLLAWSPQGDRIALSAQHPDTDRQHIFILTLETRELRNMTPLEERADSPTWSPSGEQLLYRVVRPEEPPLPSEESWQLDTSFVITSVEERNRTLVLLSEQTSPILTCPNWLPVDD